MKNIIKRKVKGYVLTFEVIMTLAMMFTLMTVTVYFLSALDAQRYMSTVLTSTSIQMSKCGGYDNSYTKLNKIGNIIDNANKELEKINQYYFAGIDRPITGEPAAITESNRQIKVELKWYYPPLKIMGFGFNINRGGGVKTMEIILDSLVEPGDLIN